jgi:hypothetical protein
MLSFVKDMEMTNCCEIYSRCSTDDQTVLSQILELKKIIQRKGLQIVVEFFDENNYWGQKLEYQNRIS